MLIPTYLRNILFTVALVGFAGCSKKKTVIKSDTDDRLDNSGVTVIDPVSEVAADTVIVHFGFDSSELSSEAESTLMSNMSRLKTGISPVVIEGHCDDRGTEEYNIGLGRRRAVSVQKYLASKDRFFKGKNVSVTSYGKSRLLDSSGTEEAHHKNRRVEVKTEYQAAQDRDKNRITVQ